jgi:2-polyprenyl-3-methyl-5-hydroxy-6-metoxy-1,4-benzoquinol methylase
MPVSDYHAVSDIMGEIQRLSPRCVLDLGCGFGKYGVLAREILDARFGRCMPDQWQAVIDGVEIFPGYRNPCWEIYNRFTTGPIRKHSGYDLVLMCDVLEHFEEVYGRAHLNQIVAGNKAVIVSVPNGEMKQGETFGNHHEAHRWTFEGTKEFEPYNFKLIHQSVCTVVSIEGMKL